MLPRSSTVLWGSDFVAQDSAEKNAAPVKNKATEEGTGPADRSPGRSRFALRLPKKPPKLVVLGSALLMAGGAIAYLNFVQRAPRSLSPAGTQLVPQTALATMTLTTDELTWLKLRQFGTAETQQQFDGLLREWKTRLFTDNGYSFKRDIKPWIGDRVTLAVLTDKAAAQNRSSSNPSGSSSGSTNALGGIETATQNLVLVVPIADPLKAKALLEAGPKNAVVSDRTYKGITVKTIKAPDKAPIKAPDKAPNKSPDGTTIQSAVIGTNWLLLSNSAAGIEQAIDTHKGGRSLLDGSDYRKAATRIESPQPPGKNFAQIYFNIPMVTQILEPPAGNTSRGTIVPLQGSDGLVATVLVESEGVRFQGSSWLSPKNDLAYSKLSNDAGEMPRRLPDDTLIMMSGSNLQRFWQGFSEGNSSPPFFPDPQNLKAGLLTQTGLDLDEDIMPWAAGEFALGVLPPMPADGKSAASGTANDSAPTNEATPGSTPGSTPGTTSGSANEPASESVIESAPLMIMVQTNDRKTAESAWAQLDDVMASRYRYQVKAKDFKGGSVTEWISPFQGVQFSHGWLPGNVTFFAVGNGAATAIAPNPQKPLAANRLFQMLTNQAPEPNNGHFYLDLASINALEGNVFPIPELPEEGATTAMQAIGMTSTVGDRTMDYDLYVKLAKAAKPGPL
jgi:hypothetical protein